MVYNLFLPVFFHTALLFLNSFMLHISFFLLLNSILLYGYNTIYSRISRHLGSF